MDAKKYKQYHELYMTQNTGTSIEECILLLSIIPFGIFISLFVSAFVPRSYRPFSEICFIFLPVILSCTIFSHINFILFYEIVFISIIITLKKLDFNNVKKLLNATIKEKKSYITNYRAGTNFFSALCILAVDFKVFPKRLSKTETYGFGFMDLGVGFYVCSNGFVEKSNSSNKFTKVLKSVLVLFVLGGIRLISVKKLNYHEHVSEYGVHWNFFFTLATCRLISYLFIMLTNYANPFWLSITIGVIHQCLLWFGLQNWVLSDAPRQSIFSANKEGLASCLGYICLYFASCSIGKFITYSSNLTYQKLINGLLYVCSFTWIGTLTFLYVDEVSRRLINLGYILWVIALSTTELILFIIVEICILGMQRLQDQNKFETVPCLFDSINANGLFFFLLANLLTGLINILFQTLLLGKVMSMTLIFGYVIVLCSVTYIMHIKKVTLKL